MDHLDLNAIIGAGIATGIVQLVASVNLKRWAFATHTYLGRLAKHANFVEQPPHPAAKDSP